MSFDFRVEADFFGHPKTDELRDILGHAGVESLLRLWAFAAQYRPDGNLSGLSDQAIEDKAHWRGDPGAFVKAATSLRSGRWLDGQKARRRLHDWQTHQPWLIGRPGRTIAAKEAARIRWEKADTERIAERIAHGNADSMQSAMPPSRPQQALTSPASPSSHVTGHISTTNELQNYATKTKRTWKLLTGREIQSLGAMLPCATETIERAMEITQQQAAKPGWGYFGSVLAGELKPKQAAPPVKKKYDPSDDGPRHYPTPTFDKFGRKTHIDGIPVPPREDPDPAETQRILDAMSPEDRERMLKRMAETRAHHAAMDAEIEADKAREAAEKKARRA